MKAVDSSAVIAAFATWHEHHSIAPPPHRANPSIVHAFITQRFTEPFLTLSEVGYQELLATIAARQILGGPSYDALIALTAAEHQATLISLDQRAVATYEAIGANVEQLVP